MNQQRIKETLHYVYIDLCDSSLTPPYCDARYFIDDYTKKLSTYLTNIKNKVLKT